MENHELEIEKMVAIAVEALDDIKGKDVVVLNTEEKTPLFSRLIVACGDSNRQVKSLGNHVAEELKKAGFDILSTEGTDSGEWVLVDAADIVVHVMLPAVRDYYDIESLWGGQKPSLLSKGDAPWQA